MTEHIDGEGWSLPHQADQPNDTAWMRSRARWMPSEHTQWFLTESRTSRAVRRMGRAVKEAVGYVLLAVAMGLIGALVVTAWPLEPDPVFTGARP